jgi:CheY-like chemotaxis protein
VNDVLDVSRIITGKVRLNVQACDVGSVVMAAAESLRPAMDAKSLVLQTDLQSSASPILGDPDRLQQVFWNVLSNAVKFTPRGGRIEISARRTDSSVAVVVKDSGIGVARGFLPHMFDRFRQADSTYSREHGGLGLGLALVRHFVELHGGTVSAESDGPGTGTAIAIELPLMVGRSDHTTPPEPTDRRSDSMLTMCPLLDYQVLAVDDNADSLAMVTDVLKEAGARVVPVRSSAAALDELSRQTFDAMVADISMPDMDGYALIRDVRSQHGGAMSAIALTAYARPEDRTRALLSGFQTHLVKPIDPVELVSTLATLGRRRSDAV